ncbi:MAG: ribosome-associated translation inhibitor RaiA [Candidatus Eisenbacteria bacterium]
MRTRLTCRHCELEPELREHVDSRIERLARYFDRVDEAHVVFTTEGHRCIADVTVHASRAVISSEQTADDMRSAFDRSIEKVERQIRRHKERIRHHKGVDATADVAMAFAGASMEDLGIVPEKLASKAMTPAEAFSELDELKVAFLVFTNSETEKINVIYRRGDGDYGLVEPA